MADCFFISISGDKNYRTRQAAYEGLDCVDIHLQRNQKVKHIDFIYASDSKVKYTSTAEITLRISDRPRLLRNSTEKQRNLNILLTTLTEYVIILSEVRVSEYN